MKIIPLDKSNLDMFVGYCYVARREPNPFLLQGVHRKQNLYASKIENGLSGLLALDDMGTKGMIEWMPLAASHLAFDIPGAVYLHCIWVRDEHAGQGIGVLLMEKFLDECKGRPVVTFGFDTPEHMPRAFFEKYGFIPIEHHMNMYLMMKPNAEWDAERMRSAGPYFLNSTSHEKINDRKPLFLYHNDFCPYNWLGLQQILADVKGRRDIAFRVFNCNFLKYPESCAEGPTLYLDGQLVNWQPASKGFVKELLEKVE